MWRQRSELTQGTVPPVCYATCNCVIPDDAYLEAQRVGKNEELCKAGSAFQLTLAACNDCVQPYQSPTAPGSGGNSTSVSSLSQFLDYCNANASAPVVDTTAPPTRLVTTTIRATTVLAGHNTTLTDIKVYTSYGPVPFTTIVPQSGTLGDGRPTVWSLTATYFSLPKVLNDDTATTSSNVAVGSTSSNSFLSTTPAMPDGPSGSLPSTHSSPEDARSMAWVAGPVVGGVAAITILALLGYWWKRRRRPRAPSTTAAGMAPEIDGKERLEIDGKSQKPELAGSRPDANAHGTNQHPIQELEAGAPYRDRDANVVHEA
ncbi:hypothetical protein PG989_012030 [Apiospora arundinis]